MGWAVSRCCVQDKLPILFLVLLYSFPSLLSCQVWVKDKPQYDKRFIFKSHRQWNNYDGIVRKKCYLSSVDLLASYAGVVACVFHCNLVASRTTVEDEFLFWLLRTAVLCFLGEVRSWTTLYQLRARQESLKYFRLSHISWWCRLLVEIDDD